MAKDYGSMAKGKGKGKPKPPFGKGMKGKGC